jgi:hypothetical protein
LELTVLVDGFPQMEITSALVMPTRTGDCFSRMQEEVQDLATTCLPEAAHLGALEQADRRREAAAQTKAGANAFFMTGRIDHPWS